MKKVFLFLLVFVILFGFFNFGASAQTTPKWEKPIGVYGGEIDKVICSPTFSNDSTIFAGGIQGFYLSTDSGKTFSSIPLNVGYNNVFEGVNDFTLSKDFSSNHAVYIGTKNGIYYTTDFGKSFKPYQMGIDATYITLLTSDPVTDTLLAVGVSYEKREDGKVLNTNLVMKHGKNEERWTTIAKFTSDYVSAIASYNDNYYVGTEFGELYKIDTQGKNLLYKVQSQISAIDVNSNGVLIATIKNGIFVSSDFKNFTNELQGERISDVKITDTNNLYALGRNATLYIKENGNYATFKMPMPSTNLSFSITTNAIYIASFEYGVIKFDKTTKTFTLSNTGITNVNTTCLSFSPNYENNKTIYLGTANNGLYVSNDGGKTFLSFGNFDQYQILDVKELSNGAILVSTLGDGLLLSNDKGKTFEPLDLLKGHSVGVIYEYSNKVFLGTEDDGLYVTDLTFKNASKVTSLYQYDVNINFIKGVSNYLFVATNGGNLYRSEDYGNTFKEIAKNRFWGLSITGFDISKDFMQDGFLFVGTAGGEFASYDRGNTFTQGIDLGLWADGVAVSPNYSKDGCLVVGAWGSSGTTYGGIFVSKNKGISFDNIGFGMTNRYVTNVYLSPDFYYGKKGSIFALTSQGLFRYTFGGSIEIILTVGKQEIVVNGDKKTIDAAPYIKNSRTLVPIRFVTEAIGANVSWNDKTKEVTISYQDKTIILQIGNPYATVNGVKLPIDKDNLKVVPEITSGRKFVPIRFVAETFGAKVDYNPQTREISIKIGG